MRVQKVQTHRVVKQKEEHIKAPVSDKAVTPDRDTNTEVFESPLVTKVTKVPAQNQQATDDGHQQRTDGHQQCASQTSLQP